jgi:hypothetical protein
VAAAIETHKSSLGQLVEAMVVLHRISLFRLFGLHADARGTRVDTAATRKRRGSPGLPGTEPESR